MEKKFDNPEIAKELERIGINNLPALLSTQCFSSLKNILLQEEGSVNTEKWPLLEFMAPVALFSGSSVSTIEDTDQRLLPTSEDLLFSIYSKRRAITIVQYLSVAEYHSNLNTRMAYSTLKKCLQINPNDDKTLVMLSNVAKDMNLTEERLTCLRKLVDLFPNDVSVLTNFAWDLYLWRLKSYSVTNVPDMSYSIELLMKCADLTERKNERFFLHLGMIYKSIGQYDDAAEAYKYVLSLRQKYNPVVTEESDEEVNLQIARIYIASKRYSEAIPFLQHAQQINPAGSEAQVLMDKIITQRKGFQ
jgi:tetratricopeptide (TPR) repeat protein